MIKIIDGIIYVDDKRTTDPELIGYGLLDYVETLKEKKFYIALENDTITVMGCQSVIADTNEPVRIII